MSTAFLSCALALAGCVGIIGEPPGLDPADGAASGDAIEPADTTRPDPLVCTTPRTGPTPMRRITRSEYNRSVHDLLGDNTAPADRFPPDDEAGGFTNNAAVQTMSVLLAERYTDAAEVLATNAAANLQPLLPCDPASGEEACARMFISRFGTRAYRRPLTSAESTRLFALYTAARTGTTFTIGIQTVIQGMLVSPNFLFRPEFGAPDAIQGSNVRLTSYEMATRLSYFLWGSTPDEALLAIAQADQLTTVEQVAAQARRMLAAARSHEAIAQFYHEWLGLTEMSGVTKDPAVYPQFNSALANAMRDETNAFVDYVLWQGDARLGTLLTAPTTFVNQRLAPLYGLTAPADDVLRRVQLDPTRSAGVLTQPSILSILGKPNQSAPVQRGRFIRERLLCQPLPDPPAGLMIVAPDPAPGQTTRQRFAEHSSNDACRGCHRLTDGFGFGFEAFDGIGRFRTTDQGIAVDSSGTIVATRDMDGTFDGVPDLARRLSASNQVRECVVTQWFRFTHGRTEAEEDACSLRSLNNAFMASNQDLRELMIALSQTPSFMYRPVIQVGQ